MKKLILAIIIVVIVTMMVIVDKVHATDGSIKINCYPNRVRVMVDDEKVLSDNFLKDDRTYMPVREIVEKAKLKLSYDQKTRTVSIKSKIQGIKKATCTDMTYQNDGIPYYKFEFDNCYGNVYGGNFEVGEFYAIIDNGSSEDVKSIIDSKGKIFVLNEELYGWR